MAATGSGREERAWKRRVRELGLTCTCWECLRRRGITPDRESSAAFRTDVTGRLFRSDGRRADGGSGS
jgi:hypothetical protein